MRKKKVEVKRDVMRDSQGDKDSELYAAKDDSSNMNKKERRSKRFTT